MLRRAGKVAAGVVPAALVAGLGLPALGTLVFLAVLAAGVACWVFGSDARTARVSRVLLAWRGDPGCLPDAVAAPALSAPQPRRWSWLRLRRHGTSHVGLPLIRDNGPLSLINFSYGDDSSPSARRW